MRLIFLVILAIVFVACVRSIVLSYYSVNKILSNLNYFLFNSTNLDNANKYLKTKYNVTHKDNIENDNKGNSSNNIYFFNSRKSNSVSDQVTDRNKFRKYENGAVLKLTEYVKSTETHKYNKKIDLLLNKPFEDPGKQSKTLKNKYLNNDFDKLTLHSISEHDTTDFKVEGSGGNRNKRFKRQLVYGYNPSLNRLYYRKSINEPLATNGDTPQELLVYQKMQMAYKDKDLLNRRHSLTNFGNYKLPDKYAHKPSMYLINSKSPPLGPFRRNDDDVSSSREMPSREQWKQILAVKQYEAIHNIPKTGGDTVQMMAARPWGMPCGDPAQHDMPWGTCMLSAECDAEFRIYRGDYFCGRSMFVCCAIRAATFDTNVGFDMSINSDDYSSDSEKEKNRNKKPDKKKDAQKRRQQRRRARLRRREQVKREIRKTLTAIRRVIKQMIANRTLAKSDNRMYFKELLDNLKQQYKQNRNDLKKAQEEQVMRIDAALMERLVRIRLITENFQKNPHLNILVRTGFMNKTMARSLLAAYPELGDIVHVRRSAGGVNPIFDLSQDFLDYDEGFIH